MYFRTLLFPMLASDVLYSSFSIFYKLLKTKHLSSHRLKHLIHSFKFLPLEMHLQIFLVIFSEIHLRIGLSLKFGRFYGFVLTYSLSLCLFVTHVQWLKTTLSELGLDMCPKPCWYNVRESQIGPRGHRLMINRLMFHNFQVHNTQVMLLIVVSLKHPFHGATSSQMMQQTLKSLKPLKALNARRKSLSHQRVIYKAHLTPLYFISMQIMLLDISENERYISFAIHMFSVN